MRIQIVSTLFLELSTDWVPIVERVPSNNYEVLFLVYDKGTGMSRCRICRYSDIEDILMNDESVTHWKEIPY
jgi:hypothetical protein